MDETGAAPQADAPQADAFQACHVPRPRPVPQAGAASGNSDPAPGAGAPSAARARSRRSTIMLATIALVSGVVFATVFAFAVTKLGARNSTPPMRPTGIPASVNTRLATLMQ